MIHVLRRLAIALLLGLGLSGSAAAQQADRLAADLDDLLGTYRWPDAEWGVMVMSLDQGDTLFSVGADEDLAPASNAKLLTTAAALSLLGPEFRFRTYLLTESPVRDGVLLGDLTLYGTGDPALSDRFFDRKTTAFQLLVDQLTESGVRVIDGDLIADASHLPGPVRPEGWDPADLNDAFAAGISALSFNENVVSFQILASSRGGLPPEVRTIPDHAGLRVVNNALTVSAGTRPGLMIVRDDPLDPVRVEGRIRRGARDVWRQLTVPSPAHFTASVFRSVLEENGIEVRGQIRVVESPAQSVVGSLTAPTALDRPRTRILARHKSPPLRELLAVINQRSNNLFAELVFRTVGRTYGARGDAAGSQHAVKSVLEGLNVPTEGLALLDGSGLSAANRVRPSTFVALIDRLSESELWPEYWATLPEAGQRRGLGRMYRTAAAGNLRAKTGTIEGVSALSGLVRSQDDERLAFSIVLNGTPSTTRAKRIENQIGARLASFTRGAEALALAVAPPTPAPVRATDESDRYRVQRGDNLSGIAERHGVSVDALLQANPTVDRNRILAGEWLALPRAPGGG